MCPVVHYCKRPDGTTKGDLRSKSKIKGVLFHFARSYSEILYEALFGKLEIVHNNFDIAFAIELRKEREEEKKAADLLTDFVKKVLLLILENSFFIT